MNFAQITCIQKTDRQNTHERIERIGGMSPDGQRWLLSIDEAIAIDQSGKCKFFVHQNGNFVLVHVAISAAGYRYLKTERDGVLSNNLLSLPECPLGGFGVRHWGQTLSRPQR